jgi:ComF family protein
MLSHFKFGSNLAIGHVLCSLLTQYMRDNQWPSLNFSWRPDVIIPVPLHTARLRRRGFNQAWEVTRFLARHLATPCSTQLLVRARDTSAQRKLNAQTRKLNMLGAFQASDHVAGLNIVLVDDVVTTGTTVTECAKALLTAGAKQVDVCALARAPRFFTSD